MDRHVHLINQKVLAVGFNSYYCEIDQSAELLLISRALHCVWTCSVKYYVR